MVLSNAASAPTRYRSFNRFNSTCPHDVLAVAVLLLLLWPARVSLSTARSLSTSARLFNRSTATIPASAFVKLRNIWMIASGNDMVCLQQNNHKAHDEPRGTTKPTLYARCCPYVNTRATMGGDRLPE